MLRKLRSYQHGDLVAIILLTIALSWAAIFNGHPFLFPDSGPYVHGATATTITLDRSPFYGLFGMIFFLGRETTGWLWAWAIAQAAIVALALMLLSRRLLPRFNWYQHLLICLPLAIFSGLPWHVTQIMPDALAGACLVLALVSLDRPLSRRGTLLLLLLLLGVTLVHNTHFFITAASGVAMSLSALITRAGNGALRRIAARTIMIVGGGAMLAITFNGLAHDRWKFAPLGDHFVFASLQQEGLTARWLDRHCGIDGPPRLCAMKSRIGRDSQQILWGEDNGVHRAVYRQASGELDPPADFIEEMGTAARGAIREEPAAFFVSVARDAATQLVTFAPLDDQCPHICTLEGNVLDLWLRDIDPQLMDNFLVEARQADGSIPKETIRAIVIPFTWAGLIALVPLGLVAFRRRDRLAMELVLGVAAVLLVSAVLTGALSEPYDRYQSRIAWLAPMALLLLVPRFLGRHPHQGTPAR